MELSEKEAKWCETEEQLNLKVHVHVCRHTFGQRTCTSIEMFILLCFQLKQQWGEKYAEWMAQTEQKLQDLQQANDLM